MLCYIVSCFFFPQTAYFVIPENVKHGEELICSYFACRNAGIKFRYCSHCKVPVAKRNFRKRHKHGGDSAPGDDEDEDNNNKRGIPSHIMAQEAADGISSQSADESGAAAAGAAEKAAPVNLQQAVRSSVRAFEKVSSTVKNNMIEEERQERWAKLLAKRPSTKDGEAMSAWLMEVLAVSDLEAPLAGEAAPAAASASNKEEEAKKSTESPHSEEGYGSSNEGTEEANKNELSASNTNGVAVIKKKRPVLDKDDNDEDDDDDDDDEKPSYASGSFAEWKERKKAKKQKVGDVGQEPL
jgi:hypothetical protein